MKHWREMGLTVSTGPPTMFFVSNPDTILGASSRGYHCVKSVRIQSFFVMHFPVFGLNTEDTRISPYLIRMRENADQKKSEYGHFSRSAYSAKFLSDTNVERIK